MAWVIAIQIFALPPFITSLPLPQGELAWNLVCSPRIGNLKGTASILHTEKLCILIQIPLPPKSCMKSKARGTADFRKSHCGTRWNLDFLGYIFGPRPFLLSVYCDFFRFITSLSCSFFFFLIRPLRPCFQEPCGSQKKLLSLWHQMAGSLL